MSVTQKLVAALLAAALVLLIGVLSWLTVSHFITASRAVDRTLDVVVRLENVMSALKDAESGQRGYLLTSDSSYLRPYTIAGDTLDAELAALRARAGGGVRRLARLDSLSAVVHEKLGELRETIELRESDGFTPAARMVRTNRGQALMNEARRLVREMEMRENAALRLQETARTQAARRSLWIIGLGTLIAVVLLVAINRSIRRDIERERGRAEVEKFFIEADAFLARAPLDYALTLQELARHAIPFLADYCGIDVLAEDGSVVRAGAAHVDAAKEPVLREMWARFPYEVDAPFGAPAVLRSGKVEFVPVIPQNETEAFAHEPEHLAMMHTLGPRSYACVPVASGERTLGAISLVFSDSGRRYDERLLGYAKEYARRAANVLERARLHRDATESARRLGYIARASEILSASLDYEVTLAALARLVVPELADWCAVTIVAENGVQRQLAVAHVDPAKVAWARELNERYPPDPNSSSGVPHVIRTGMPEFYPVISPEMLKGAAQNDEHRRIIENIGFRSGIIVPISARGRTLGAITLVTAESGKRYTRDDLALAEELGGRAGVAIDNAQLLLDARASREEADRSRRAALSANKAKSDFLATMSHEIRTPINAVLGYTELLELGLSGPLTDEQRTQLDRIRASTRHLLGLVNEVLDLAKIESGTMRIEAANAVTGDTVEAALAMIRPQAVAKGVTLSEHCEGSRDALYMGDEHRARQVLTNLLANALKFTEPGGTIQVDCAVRDDPPEAIALARSHPYVAFRVRDSGIGIAPEQLDAIFQPFVQAPSERLSPYTRERTGAGLGLAISRQLAQLMHGEITVESVVGRGSTFTFWVPAAGHRAGPLSSDGHRRAAEQRAAELSNLSHPPSGEEEPATPLSPDHEAVGNAILAGIGPIIERWRNAIRADPLIPSAKALPYPRLDNHAASLVTDVALAVRTLSHGGPASWSIIRDGAAILRTIAEQHGTQRLRLRWSEDAIPREMELLTEAVVATIRGVPGVSDEAKADSTKAARELLTQAARVSVGTYRLGMPRITM